MKRMHTFYCTVLLILIPFVHSDVHIDNQSCSRQFQIDALSSETSIRKLDHPVSSKLCGTEFTTYGTCCDPKTFEQTVNIMHRYTYTALGAMNTEYRKFVRAIGLLKFHLNLIVAAATKPGFDKKLSSLAKAILSDPSVNGLSSTFTTASIKEFESESKKCWLHVNKVRQASICAHCSGRGHRFQVMKDTSGSGFIPTLVVADNDCNKMVQECRTAYLMGASFLQAVHYFSYSLLPILDATLEIKSHANLKINPIILQLFLKYLGAKDDLLISQGLQNNEEKVNPHFCKRILSSGRMTILEVFPMIFQSGYSWGITSKHSDFAVSLQLNMNDKSFNGVVNGEAVKGEEVEDPLDDSDSFKAEENKELTRQYQQKRGNFSQLRDSDRNNLGETRVNTNRDFFQFSTKMLEDLTDNLLKVVDGTTNKQKLKELYDNAVNKQPIAQDFVDGLDKLLSSPQIFGIVTKSSLGSFEAEDFVNYDYPKVTSDEHDLYDRIKNKVFHQAL